MCYLLLIYYIHYVRGKMVLLFFIGLVNHTTAFQSNKTKKLCNNIIRILFNIRCIENDRDLAI